MYKRSGFKPISAKLKQHKPSSLSDAPVHLKSVPAGIQLEAKLAKNTPLTSHPQAKNNSGDQLHAELTLPITDPFTTKKLEQAINQFRLQITASLQTTLELPELLKNFHRQLDLVLGICGAEFIAKSIRAKESSGETAKHSFSYNISTADKSLGELRLYSHQSLSEADLMLAEIAISQLVYPINNAIDYAIAIQQAQRDPLTDLGNRAAMDKAISREHSRTSRHQSPFSILMIDIDHFKGINDSYGHTTGDRVIASVAKVLKRTAREADNAFRYGGEEFLVLLDNTDSHGAMIAAERIRQRVAALPTKQLKLDRPISVSIGCATLDEDESIVRLTDRADSAMYRAKSSGRNCVCSAETYS